MTPEEALKIARETSQCVACLDYADTNEAAPCLTCKRIAAAILKAHQEADTAAKRACAEIATAHFDSWHTPGKECRDIAAKILATIKEPR